MGNARFGFGPGSGLGWETLVSGPPGPSLARSSAISALHGGKWPMKRSRPRPLPGHGRASAEASSPSWPVSLATVSDFASRSGH